ncbi:hypothetical protein GUJ93_ZPchr0008g11706 [Zizania palustris]|uniref:RING-type E3 ubiquitin transferase n=1 Tax=Zizania palustris TaxID=103762 RepID=A0A8J5VGL3_ZIZPA|nr:hypothetical protein GUJ93_ZPchr0008g11706 [Zizania palustris]
MDESMGRRTASGLLLTRGGSILVFREDGRRHEATACCTRVGCSSKISRDQDKKMQEAVAPRRSQLASGSNRMPHQTRMACGSSSRRPGPGGETVGKDVHARLKHWTNAERKRPLSGGSSPTSPNTIGAASSRSRPAPRPLHHHRPAQMTRKEASRNGSATSGHRRAGFQRSTGMFMHGDGLQEQPAASYLEDSSTGHWNSVMDGSDQDTSNDRHRGMRMDIDGMSYEELLALGERIGTVSTGLSDDALSKCLKRILYVASTSTSHEDGDIKCIICQEEYLPAEEVAEMACKHHYHIVCIEEWLGQKNWCPICKSVAFC